MKALLYIRLEQFRMLLKKSVGKTSLILLLVLSGYVFTAVLTVFGIPIMYTLPALILILYIHLTRRDNFLINKTGLPHTLVYLMEYSILLLPAIFIGILLKDFISAVFILVTLIFLTFILPVRHKNTSH